MKSAETIFRHYLNEKGLLYSKQQEQILAAFVKIKNNPTVDDLYNTIRRKNSKIGLATVYRTMRAICDCGLAEKVDFGDGARRFEHKHRYQQHYHLICIKCGRVIEVTSGKIENLQKKLAKQHNFTPTKDTMKIFGVCNKCQQNEKQNR